jgi:hypothetical protein
LDTVSQLWEFMPMLPYGVETLGTLINHPTPFTGFVSRDHRQKPRLVLGG